RQAQGVVKAKGEGKYRGRPEDKDRNAGIAGMLRSGMSWTAIQAATGCSRADHRQGPRQGRVEAQGGPLRAIADARHLPRARSMPRQYAARPGKRASQRPAC
ncbi:MAG TPA: hypothetical protein VFE60_26750, partial [Roseiarcus sp.]|nr:hypothetical protein [Roseiarcus sp.]